MKLTMKGLYELILAQQVEILALQKEISVIKEQRSQKFLGAPVVVRCGVCGKPKNECTGHVLCSVCHGPDGKHGGVWIPELGRKAMCPNAEVVDAVYVQMDPA